MFNISYSKGEEPGHDYNHSKSNQNYNCVCVVQCLMSGTHDFLGSKGLGSLTSLALTSTTQLI